MAKKNGGKIVGDIQQAALKHVNNVKASIGTADQEIQSCRSDTPSPETIRI
jgi:hypothetical protein